MLRNMKYAAAYEGFILLHIEQSEILHNALAITSYFPQRKILHLMTTLPSASHPPLTEPSPLSLRDISPSYGESPLTQGRL